MRIIVDAFDKSILGPLIRGLNEQDLEVQVVLLENYQAEPGPSPFILLSGKRDLAPNLQILKKLNTLSNKPIIVVLAQHDSNLRPLLRQGVRDFVLPPYLGQEIAFRLRTQSALLQKRSFGNVHIDIQAHRVTWPHRQLKLTAIEARLLDYLWSHEGQSIGREQLLRSVWGYQAAIDTRAVALTVSRLRKKIESSPDNPAHLQTVYGVGYRWLSEKPLTTPDHRAVILKKLPETHGEFIGRAQALQQVEEWLKEKSPYIQLHGPGGIGKTRLALQALQGATLQGATLPWPICYIDLTGVEDESTLLAILTRALSLPINSWPIQSEAIANYLRQDAHLLFFDNAEGCFVTLQRLCASLRHLCSSPVLVTSRIRLAVEGLKTLSLPGLPSKDGLKLFVSRAQNLGLASNLESAKPEQLSELVQFLGGSPLAIELAASQMLILRPNELLNRLKSNLNVLHQDQPNTRRHQSLSQTFDDSWRLLTHSQQELLVLCACFNGGIALPALEGIQGGERTRTLSDLSTLIAHSWLQSQPSASESRFTMLGPICQFLQGKQPYLASALKHLGHFAATVKHIATDVVGPDIFAALGSFDKERGNIVTALKVAVEQDPNTAAQMTLDLSQILWVYGEAGVLDLIQQLDFSKIDGTLSYQVKLQKARFLLRYGDMPQARSLTLESLDAAGSLQCPELEINAHSMLGFIHTCEGNHLKALEQRPFLESLFEKHDFPRLRGVHLAQMATCYRLAGKLSKASDLQQQAIKLVSGKSALWNEMLIRGQHSLVLHKLGRLKDAQQAIQPQLEFFKRLGDKRSECICRINLATYLIDDFGLDEAEKQLDISQPFLKRISSPLVRAFFNCITTKLLISRRNYDAALAKSQEILDRHPDSLARAVSHSRLLRVWIFHLGGEPERALEEALEVLRRYEETGNQIETAVTLLKIATLYEDLQDSSSARAHFERAKSTFFDGEIIRFYQLLELTEHYLKLRQDKQSPALPLQAPQFKCAEAHWTTWLAEAVPTLIQP